MLLLFVLFIGGLLAAGTEDWVIENIGLSDSLVLDTWAAAAAANAAAANGFVEFANEFPFRNGALLMNGDKPLRLNNINWAAAADGGNAAAEAAAIAAVAWQMFGNAADWR